MSLTPAQLQTLKTAILAETDPELVAYRTNGQTGLIADWYNKPGTFIVWRSRVNTAEIGLVVNYEAVGAMTTANRDRIITFYTMNPEAFDPTADIRLFWDSTFSGALAGQGANTRAALQALWKRPATRAERLFATGVGTTATPGALVFVGEVSVANVDAALAQ
jgi:hypothetical protein